MRGVDCRWEIKPSTSPGSGAAVQGGTERSERVVSGGQDREVERGAGLHRVSCYLGPQGEATN